MVSVRPRPRQLFRLAQWMHGEGRLVQAVRRASEHLLGLDRINALYADLPPREVPQDFFRLYLEALRISLDCDQAALGRIPARGPCVVVANHPFGFVEGIALGALLAAVRPDFKFLGNYLLEDVPDVRPFNLPVDPFGRRDAARRNFPSLRAALRWVTGGGVLVLFPAGEVAHFDLRQRRVTDPPWQPHLARLLRRSRAPVLPIHFSGGNSASFHLLGMVHPMLRTLRLPAELLNKRGTTLQIAVGTPLPPEWLGADASDVEVMEDLRARTHALGGQRRNHGPLAVRAVAAAPAGAFPPSVTPTVPIAPPEATELLSEEIGLLPAECRLGESRDFLIFCADAGRIPHTLREIGRQREMAFRHVGEGNGRAIDLARFDEDYHHLFVWSRFARELVGAYRIGQADEIVRRRGIAGLYTSTLFHYDTALLDRIGPLLELGRSFVRVDYQRSFGALHLLWRGIGQYVARQPRYRHLMGAVSISDEYSSMSQQLITTFLQVNHLSADFSGSVLPRNPLRFASQPALGTEGDPEPIPDLDALSARVLELESGRRDVPILLKQYLKLGGRLLGVNRDPQFGNAIDGLIVVDLLGAPRRVVERYLGVEGLQTLQAYHARVRGGVAS